MACDAEETSLGKAFLMKIFKMEDRRMLLPLYRHLVVFTLCFPGFVTMYLYQIFVPRQALVMRRFHLKNQFRIYLIHGAVK